MGRVVLELNEQEAQYLRNLIAKDHQMILQKGGGRPGLPLNHWLRGPTIRLNLLDRKIEKAMKMAQRGLS